ncbi:MAG: AMP-binding protein, partial [Chloroflexota bacterium]|nr:AMP-binding protein [Chloroflexota bacterium]
MTTWLGTSLAQHGDRAALVTEDGTITYAELAGRVDDEIVRLGSRRRLVLLAAANHPDAVVHYLAAIAAGHPPILVDASSPHAVAALAAAYDPDVVVRPSDTGGRRWVVEERRASSRHELHPDLALLLSTSGSTGSPKLVRLSHENLRSNAEAIGSYLELSADDRAVTSLPMAYSYGLSVINSHLLRGASVVLTDRSVIDPEFWSLLRRTRATSFAGVPYTFELLDRVGFAGMALPHLRHVTQAGGRLEPHRVREYAELGRRRGWRLFVMYGQTEATARMAYLPPEIAPRRPETIGVPIPGGSLRIEPVPGAPDGAGELVYSGPNVMLGYADGPDDLALGRTVEELRTGDIGRRTADGLYEVVGRRGGFVKIAGMRIDPQGVERLLADRGVTACAVGTDERLVVFVERGAVADPRDLIRGRVCVPLHALSVVELAALPRLANGKLDRPALEALATSDERVVDAPRDGNAAIALRELYATALGRADVSDDESFATLGGDSLSYVEVTLGLEEILGRLPEAWETMSLRELARQAAPARAPRSRWSRLTHWRSIEMSVALRALAIVLIVGSHIGMLYAYGGAHVLMAVAGYNFARFRLTPSPSRERLAAQLRAVARIALPAMAWVAAVMLLLGEYELRHLFLVNALVRDELWGNLWFIELLVYINLALAAVLAVPALDRAERRWPFAVPIIVLGIGLLFRYDVVDLAIPHTKPVLWLFAIGWAASRAERAWQRWLVIGITLVSVPGYFDSWDRNAIILAGVLLLVGVRRVFVPAALARIGGVLAGASLYIYLVHWEVWPRFEGWYGLPSLLASLAVGVALWLAVPRIT